MACMPPDRTKDYVSLHESCLQNLLKATPPRLSIDSPASILHGPGSLCLIRGARGLIGQGRSVSRCRNTSMHKLRSYPVCALSSEVFLILIASIPPLLRAIAYLAISSQTLISPFNIST